MPITIFLTARTGLPEAKRKIDLAHQVSFEGKGKWKTINIAIDKDAAARLGIK